MEIEEAHNNIMNNFKCFGHFYLVKLVTFDFKGDSNVVFTNSEYKYRYQCIKCDTIKDCWNEHFKKKKKV